MLDLDAIERKWAEASDAGELSHVDVPALVAETRRLLQEAEALHERLWRLAESAKRVALVRDRAREEARLWRALAWARRRLLVIDARRQESERDAALEDADLVRQGLRALGIDPDAQEDT